jgi:hypothetical protein
MHLTVLVENDEKCETIAYLLPEEKEEKVYGTQEDGKRGYFQDD